MSAWQRQFISPVAQKYLIRCRTCGKIVDLVTFGEASEIIGAALDQIIEYAATGEIHVIVRPEAMLVCLNSLLAVNFNWSPKPFAVRRSQALTTKNNC